MNRIIYFIAFIISLTSTAQVSFQKAYGGSGNDDAAEVKQTIDGGFICVGTSESFGAGVSDIYLVKTDRFGTIKWTRTFGGPSADIGRSVQQTLDKGYIITGCTNSYGAGSADVYLIKVDSNGLLLWSKTFGGTGNDQGYSVKITTDHGYIITGAQNISNYGFGGDVYLIKTDSVGTLQWTKVYGGPTGEIGYSIQETNDKGFIITGCIDSYGAGGFDLYLIKTGSDGSLKWAKTYGDTGGEFGRSVLQCTDNGFIMLGTSAGYGADPEDFYVVKTDSTGNLQWTRTYGRIDNDQGFAIAQNGDGSYILTGSSCVFEGGGNRYDLLAIKINSQGGMLWARVFGSLNKNEWGYFGQETNDSCFIFCGRAVNAGPSTDLYLVSADVNGHTLCYENSTPIINVGTRGVQGSGCIVSSGGVVGNSPTQIGAGGTEVDLCRIITSLSQSISPEFNYSLFPNPSTGSIFIKSSSFVHKLELRITNAMGELIDYKLLNNGGNILNEQLELSPFSKGVYFLEINEGPRKEFKKIILE